MEKDRPNNAKHINEHLNKLSDLISDLEIVSNSNGEFLYQSTANNSHVDQVIFTLSNIDEKSQISFAHPFRKIKIDCSFCDGDLTIYSNPRKIPIAIFANRILLSNNKFFQWYGLAYESLLKYHNFNPLILLAIQKQIIGDIQSYSVNSTNVMLGPKPDLTYLNASIKKLLPFI